MAPRVLTSHEAARVEHLLVDRVPILPGRLDFALLPAASAPSSIDNEETAETNSSNELVCFDEDLVYSRFFADFGPLNLGQTMRFVRDIDSRISRVSSSGTGVVVVFTSDHPHRRANCMTLIALYLVISHDFSPVGALLPFRTLNPPYGFRDAALGVCTFQLSLLDCVRAVHKAMTTRVWTPNTFNVEEFERLARLENGDMTWIIPGKLLAFRGPRLERERAYCNGDPEPIETMLAHEYAKALSELGISCVVRFNEPASYDRKAFIHAGLRHVELEYPDGGVPSDAILLQFLRICEREIASGGAVAAHCAAGLGRTGTHAAAWLMRSAGFSAREAIAWCRICRPGSVVGPQQHFLVAKEPLITCKATDEVRVKAERRPASDQERQRADKARESHRLRPVVVRKPQLKPPPVRTKSSVLPTWSSTSTRSTSSSGGRPHR